MKNLLKITLIANEGILFQTPEITLLIDALHHDPLGVPDFSPVSEQLLRQIIHHESIFSSVDYLLFTHNHGDHFSPYFTKRYIECNRPRGLIVPYSDTEEYAALIQCAKKRRIPYYELNLPFFEKHCFSLSHHVELSVFRTNHASTIFTDTENYCFLLKVYGKNHLFLADADYDVSYLKTIIGKTAIQTVYVNPLFINKSEGRQVLLEAVNPQNIIIYHLPFESDNKWGFRYLNQRDVKRYADILPPMKVLKDELQNITLAL